MLKLTKRERDRAEKEGTLPVVDQELEEHLSVLNAEDRAAITRVSREVDTKIVEASKESVRDKKLLEEGRCPSCGHKVEKFLFTTICESCGWSEYNRPQEGRAVVHLRDGETLTCEQTFSSPEEVLCVTNDVVRYRVPRSQVLFIEYDWTELEIDHRRSTVTNEEQEVCDWCGKLFARGDEDARATFAAIGREQQRFMFCCDQCQHSFQKQYPTRVHRDCYNRDCSKCGECMQKFEDSSYENFVDEDLVH